MSEEVGSGRRQRHLRDRQTQTHHTEAEARSTTFTLTIDQSTLSLLPRTAPHLTSLSLTLLHTVAHERALSSAATSTASGNDARRSGLCTPELNSLARPWMRPLRTTSPLDYHNQDESQYPSASKANVAVVQQC